MNYSIVLISTLIEILRLNSCLMIAVARRTVLAAGALMT